MQTTIEISSGRSRRQHLHPRLQRQTTIFRRVTRLSLSKTNPYVGSFRHSPPTSARSLIETIDGGCWRVSSTMIHCSHSPYTGTFRHAPPSSSALRKLSSKKRGALGDFSVILESQGGKKKNKKKKLHHIYIDGHLRGGSPFPDWGDTTHLSRTLRRSLEEPSTESNSAAVQVLTRLASWLIHPIVPYDERLYNSKRVPMVFPPQHTTSDDEDSDVESDIEEEEDDDASSISTVGTHLALDKSLSTEANDLLTVSSLAEAYHAHQAAVGAQQYLDQSIMSMSSSPQYSDHDMDPNRLDYVITQMDIARMARNASRHLDVESILNLPTTTYRSDSSSSVSSRETIDDGGVEEAGWSWMIVPPAREEKESKEDRATKNVCVICLEHFAEGDRLRVLPCNHSFHVGCVDRWLSGSHSFEECYTSGCPTCKKRPTECVEASLDGSVPSWAFARIGDALARQQQHKD